MDEAAKTADAVQSMQDEATRAGYAALDQTAKAVAEQTSHMAEAGEKAKERMTSTAEDIARTERKAMVVGARSMADMGSRLTETSVDRSHKMVASAANVIDIYRDAAERSSGRVQALLAAWMTVGRGVQQMQHAWLEVLDDNLASDGHKPQDLLHCRSVVELAEVQRDLYISAVDRAFHSSSRMLEIAARTAQDAVRPLTTGNH